MGLIGSLRTLAQLKGYHLESVRGRQQYAGRHLWAANLWNRAVSLYFRNGDPAGHPDFGPRYARWQAEIEEQFVRVGGQPDMDGTFAGRKVTPETLAELRGCIRAGGALVPLGQDRGARCGRRPPPRPRPRRVLRQSEVGGMTDPEPTGTTISTTAPMTGSSPAADVTTRRDVKPIPDDGYYLTASCVMGTFARPSSPSSRAYTTFSGGVGPWVGPAPASQNTCCSGIVTHGNVFTVESSLLVVARLWSVCAEAGLENITTACVTSFAIHNEILRTAPQRARAGREGGQGPLSTLAGGGLSSRSTSCTAATSSTVTGPQLAQLMRYRLVDTATGRPLKVVDHVGCHYNKIFPSKSVGGTEYCDVLTAMIREWGGEEVDYPERRHCCGMGFRQCMIRPNRSFTVACARKKFESMAPFAPDLIITNCPGCGLVFDREQWAVNELTGANFRIPVLNYARAGRPACSAGTRTTSWGYRATPSRWSPSWSGSVSLSRRRPAYLHRGPGVRHSGALRSMGSAAR